MSGKELSNAEIIRIFTRELLNDCMLYTAKEIKEYTENQMNSRHSEYPYVNQDEETGRWFTDGNYAGALRDLVAKEKEYIQCGRGVYKKQETKYIEDEWGMDICCNVDRILEGTIEEIKEYIRTIDPLKINKATFFAIEKTNEIIDDLEHMRIDLLEFNDEVNML